MVKHKTLPFRIAKQQNDMDHKSKSQGPYTYLFEACTAQEWGINNQLPQSPYNQTIPFSDVGLRKISQEFCISSTVGSISQPMYSQELVYP